MAGLTKEQFEEVQSLLAKQNEFSQRLSPGQKWEAGVMIGAFTALAIALLGFGGRVVVETAAKQGAQLITGDVVAARLGKDPDFIKSIVQSAPSLPSGSVIAISTDRTKNGEQPQCPSGWSFFAEGAGRFILGAGAGGGLSPRAIGERGGEELHTLVVAELPPQQVEISGIAARSQTDRLNAGGHDYPVLGITTGIFPIKGGGQPIPMLPPYLVLNLCKKD